MGNKLLIILFLFLFALPILSVNDSEFRSAYMHYKKGEHEKCLDLLSEYIHTDQNIYSTDKKVMLYFLTESNIFKLNTVLHRLYNEEKLYPGKNFFTLVYIFMDKAILLNQYSKILYWGEILRQRGRSNQYYLKGLYLYACVLFTNKKYQTLQLVLDEALTFEKAVRYKEKFLLINSARPNEKYSMKKNHIRTIQKSPYRILIYNNLIKFYKKKGKIKEAKRLRRILYKYNKLY